MTPEDFKKIEEMIEDASWRTVAFVALILGHYWMFLAALLMPLALRVISWLIAGRHVVAAPPAP